MKNIVIEKLNSRNLTVSVAESMTGGLLAATITSVPGASKVFKEGIITYSNTSKVKYLKVKLETLTQFSEYSKEVAYEMAKGIKELTKSDIGVSITGVAGPDGGTDDIPIGTVFIGVAREVVKVYHFTFVGDRNKIRQSACQKALEMINEELKDDI